MFDFSKPEVASNTPYPRSFSWDPILVFEHEIKPSACGFSVAQPELCENGLPGQPDDSEIHLSSDMERPWIRWGSCGSHDDWAKMVKCTHAMGHDVVGTGAIRSFGGR